MRLIITGALLTALAGCGGGAGTPASPLSGAPPEVLEALKVPPSPYYIIYSPPVDLAKKKPGT